MRVRRRYLTAACVTAVYLLALLPGAQVTRGTESLWAGAAEAHASPAQRTEGSAHPAPQAQAFCFQETGFCIESPAFRSYFSQRGGSRILGFPVSREFTLEGARVQFFQRVVLQLQGDRVQRLNVLDPAVMPMRRANRSTFPAPEPNILAGAPPPNAPDYGRRVAEFIRATSPDTFNGLPVRFNSLFNNTVPVDIAFPGSAPDPNLLALLNLEIWGFPTSAPAPDPNNPNFIYQRFQRGIMHYRNDCRCTDGILVGDYFKAVITGRNLPPDLAADMQDSRYFSQYSPGGAYWVARPSALPQTNMTEAFDPGPGSVPPPEERLRITLPAADLARLANVLAAHGMSAADVNTYRTVTSTLPAAAVAGAGGSGGMVMMSAPLVSAPRAEARDLTGGNREIVMGVMKAGRALPLTDSQVSSLPADVYLVKVRRGQMVFVASGGREYAPPSLKVQTRHMTRNVDEPQTILTAMDMCYAWNHVQVCTEPAPSSALTQQENGAMSTLMRQAVDTLVQRNILTAAEASEINVSEYIPDAEGKAAVQNQQASILAAPTMSFPAQGQEAVHDALLGVVNVLLDVEVPGFPTVPRGAYAVRAMQKGNEWWGVFVDTNRRRIEVPSQLLEIRGEIERPMAMVVNLRIGLCFWEC